MNNKQKLGLGVTIGTGTSNYNIISKHFELAEEQDIEFVELSIYDWNIICGRKIITSELNKLKNLCKNKKLNYTVHGELSVNLLDEEHRMPSWSLALASISLSDHVTSSSLKMHL